MKDKYIIYQAEMLTDVIHGIHTRWTYWSDGSVTEEKIPKGIIIFPPLYICP